MAKRSWWISKTLAELDSQLKKLYPADKLPDWFIGDASHKARKSDHNPDNSSYPPGVVRAVDIRQTGGRGNLNEIAEAIRRGKDKRIKYVIYSGKMFSSYSHTSKGKTYLPYEWRPYRWAKKMPHTNHVHVSVKKIGDNDSSPLKLEGTLKPKDIKPVNPHRIGIEKSVLETVLTGTSEWKKNRDVVKEVQRLVNTPADGIWGKNSRAAMKRYFGGSG